MKKKTLLLAGVCTLTLCSCGGGSTPEPTPTTTFTVIFDGNGGTLVSGNEVQKVSKASEIVAPTYKRDGYTFSGWDKTLSTITTDTTVKAQWTVDPTPTTEFTVTFNGNGGTLVSGNEIQKVSKASEIVAPTYKRDGYTFSGWDKTLSTITTDTTVKAQWTVAPTPTTEFTVTFNGNGGTLVSGTEVQKVKSASELVPPTYKKSGYTFDGWDKDIESITTSTTVTAKWLVNPQTEYTIYFDLNGGSSSTCPSSKKVKSIDKDTFVYDVTKEGYNFRGWMYNNNVVFDENGNQKSTVSLVDGMTFKAKFVDTAKLHITTNNPDAVESISQDKECTYYTKVDIFAHPKQGYRFTGWYSVDKSGTEIKVSTEEEYKFQMWTEDATLSAHFDINSYKLNLWSNNPDLGEVLDANDPSRQSHDKTEISHQYLSNATISAISTTESVRFLGWYNEKNELVVHDAVYKFIMVNYDYKLEAKWNRFNITYELNGGTNDSRNPATYASESNIPLYPATKPNYTFTGWELDGQVVSSIDGSWIKHITLNATYVPIDYDVVYHMNGGINNPGNITKFNIETETFTLLDPTRAGYNFVGWYSDSSFQNKITQITKGSYGQKDVYAKWSDPIVYNISYELNGGINNPTNPSTYTVENKITFASPTKTGYSFVNWTKDGSPITGISKGTTGNISITANWNINQYQVNVYTNDENKGTVTGDGSYNYGSSVTVVANPIGEYVFNGWYSDSEHKVLLAKDTSYTLTVPSGGISLYAKFWTKAEEEEEKWNKAHGVIPVISEDGKTLTYGLYPQTHVNDSALIAELEKVAPEADEEYFLYNHEYYVKDTGNPCNSSYTFSDGTTVKSGTTYFFKCEPIKWNIKGTDTNYTIDCSSILYAHTFDYDSNVYANSELRTWLNNNFYNKAFSIKTTASYIQPTDLTDVSVTGDKVWVGSKDQYDGTWYTSDSARQKKASDFALCNYAWIYSSNGLYWTRSSNSSDSRYAWGVSNDGYLSSYCNVYYSYNCGISPTVTIKI